MSKSAAPILIQVDTQEARSGIPDLLAQIDQVHIAIARLAVGDYQVGGQPLRLIERKSASDFLASIQDQRLFLQTTAMLAAGVQPILLLEGDPLRETAHSAMQPAAIRGALTYLAGVQGIAILPSSDPAESARLIASLAKQLQGSVAKPTLFPQRKATTLPDQQLNVVLALPGIGKAIA
jgi:Fanconi anemia group M protein